jgi:hypothetical protein
MRLGTRDLEKDYNKTEDDLKALQVRSARRLAFSSSPIKEFSHLE